MVRFIILSLLCGVVYQTYRTLQSRANKSQQPFKNNKPKANNVQRQTLVRDPKTGEYRVDRGLH